jgi:hypothetical protein
LLLKGENANTGSQAIKLDPNWAAPGNAYNIKVSLQSDPKVFGMSIKPFTVIPTKVNFPINFARPF